VSLQHYRRKRDFAKTPEPAGRFSARRTRGLRFVVHKHAARNLHYDFRLELDGALASWAVPKGPSLDPADKRLAVHVEDHPLDYADFEGVIPERQYGAGSVVVWDSGTWIPDGDPRRGYREGHLEFALAGKKLRGRWALVRMKGRDAPKEPWLLIKERDDEARPGHGADLLDEAPESVRSHRTVEDVAAGRKPARPRATAARAKARRNDAVPTPGRLAALPARLEPELATLVATPPAGGDWLYEIKFDGYRILARIDAKGVRLYSRNAIDWTDRFPQIARDLAQRKLGPAWLDGEVCVLDPRGRPSFQALQRALSGEGGPMLYFLFDAPFLRGRDLRPLPLRARRDALERALGSDGARSTLRFSAGLSGDGREMLAAACRSGLEGVIGKRADSAYSGRRTRSWIKLKCRQRQEFVVGGYSPPEGSRHGFGSLLLGVHEPDGTLRYAGRVGTGFDDATLADLARRLARLRRAEAPFADPPRGRLARGVRWVEPRLVAEVSFAEWTGDGLVRQASFQGLREDKPEDEVTREVPRSAARARERADRPTRVARAAKGRDPAPAVAGVTLSHPDRVVYADANATKLMVAEYYAKVARRMLPHLADRPVSIVRCPEGAARQCFYQKHARKATIPGVRSAPIEDGTGRHPYLVVETERALAGVAQMNVLELHVWGARVATIERPDTLVLDLDPDPALPWASVVAAARLVRALMQELGLEPFVKTTGGHGLHVVLPLVRRHGWDDVKGFARSIAARLAGTLPAQFTATMGKEHRGGRIFVDYLRNARGATAVAPYSLRARPGATVATPLGWDELSAKVPPSAFTIATVPKRIESGSDPWADYEARRQRLTAAMRRALSASGPRRGA